MQQIRDISVVGRLYLCSKMVFKEIFSMFGYAMEGSGGCAKKGKKFCEAEEK